MSTPFDTLTALRDEWQALQPLSSENDARLWKKLRLEWNYHSNHIEGNTLTYGETELLLLHDRTTGNHSHREYLEMKAHDVGIEHVRSLAADKTRLLTESDIRDLNKIILKESFWKAAETADGQPTRKEIIPGQYKTTPNNVRLPNGDIFFFASVEDTPPRMSALAAWMRQELESPTLHPVAFAAKLHHDFVLIHPFDDGNGRVARLLVNYVLMRSGYLPLIVRTEDKANYLTALQLADAGELSALIGYFHQLTEWSLNLGIKAAKGKAIEEPSDVEKEVEIFVRRQKTAITQALERSYDSVAEVISQGVNPLFAALNEKLTKLAPLFASHRVSYRVGAAKDIRDLKQAAAILLPNLERANTLEVMHQFTNYSAHAWEAFDVNCTLMITFEHDFYRISRIQGTDGAEITRKRYGEILNHEDIDLWTVGILKGLFEEVKSNAGTEI
jgi:Fic family protein